MQKFFAVLLMAAAAAGVIWYESKPTTVRVPVSQESSSVDYGSYYEEEPPTTEDTAPTTTQVSTPEVNFDHPDVTLDVTGKNGDDVHLVELIGKPQHLDELDEAVSSVIASCDGVTDRDMVVEVNAKAHLTSSLAAEVSVDFNTRLQPAAFEFSSGLECSEGNVSLDMHPGNYSQLRYWVVLTGAVTPDHPNGDFANHSWTLMMPGTTLPNLEGYNWKMWGSRVLSCPDIFGNNAKVWLAGKAEDDCKPVTTEATAVDSL